MADEHFQVGVIVAKYHLDARWAENAWRPETALPAVPSTPPWTRLVCNQRKELIYAGSFEVSLHSGATAYYRDNLTSGRPSLWIGMQCTKYDDCRILAVTVDPYEGEALTDWTSIIVEAVPMHPEIRRRVARFVGRFHQERSFIKRRRDNSGLPPSLKVEAGNPKWDAKHGS